MRPDAGADARRDSRQYATFVVHDLFLGVDVLKVQEVLRYQQMTPVPRAEGVIEGLINLRGQIVGVDHRDALGRTRQRHVERTHSVLDVADDATRLDHDHTIEFEALDPS